MIARNKEGGRLEWIMPAAILILDQIIALQLVYYLM
jgi:hypothetical protein